MRGSVRLTRSIARTVAVVAISVAALIVPARAAQAAPVRGAGQAQGSETKKSSPQRTRGRALRRARRAALSEAMGRVEGPVDRKAKAAALKAVDAWTGSYRIISERSEGDTVFIEVEAEIDIVRLGKRLQPADASSKRAVFRLGDVGASEACGELPEITTIVGEELTAAGGIELRDRGEPVDIALDCQPLGPVQHTHLQAASVRISATAQGRTVVEQRIAAFANDPRDAVLAGVRDSLAEVAVALATHRRGRVRLHVRDPWPTARVRRLATTMRNSISGIDRVDVAEVAPGVVHLEVRGRLDASRVSRALEELSWPDFSVSTVDVESPDALTIRLQ